MGSEWIKTGWVSMRYLGSREPASSLRFIYLQYPTASSALICNSAKLSRESGSGSGLYGQAGFRSETESDLFDIEKLKIYINFSNVYSEVLSCPIRRISGALLNNPDFKRTLQT
jgi:hypothetical protein